MLIGFVLNLFQFIILFYCVIVELLGMGNSF